MALVEIETKWNLETEVKLFIRENLGVEIETKWNLEVEVFSDSKYVVEVEIETKWNLEIYQKISLTVGEALR